jgi:hypothetical protein
MIDMWLYIVLGLAIFFFGGCCGVLAASFFMNRPVKLKGPHAY